MNKINHKNITNKKSYQDEKNSFITYSNADSINKTPQIKTFFKKHKKSLSNLFDEILFKYGDIFRYIIDIIAAICCILIYIYNYYFIHSNKFFFIPLSIIVWMVMLLAILNAVADLMDYRDGGGMMILAGMGVLCPIFILLTIRMSVMIQNLG